MAQRKNIVLLGATGSIGESTLKVVRAHPDKLRIIGAAACNNADQLAAIANEFEIPHLVLFDEHACEEAQQRELFKGRKLTCGMDGLIALATLPDADIVEVAIVGTTGLLPTLAALEAGKDIALASKEVMVLGGAFVMAAAAENKRRMLPLDSEHNALFQCLEGESAQNVAKIILTASGGAFRDLPLEQFACVTPDQALEHPNWDMGAKVTIDSATMANKGLEVIEAKWLFGMEPQQIEVVIHPQSIVHSMIQYVDGSIIAQLSPPSMTFAIQHALLYPDRAAGVLPTLDFSQQMRLDFAPPDAARYPCLGLAQEALKQGGTAPALFNAANEVAVEQFLARKIPFLAIPTVIAKTIAAMPAHPASNPKEAIRADAQARAMAQSMTSQIHG